MQVVVEVRAAFGGSVWVSGSGLAWEMEGLGRTSFLHIGGVPDTKGASSVGS